jgi:hypothetical protein
MASGHVNRINRPNTWLHRPMLQNVKKALANPEPSTYGTNPTIRDVPQFGRCQVNSGHDTNLPTWSRQTHLGSRLRRAVVLCALMAPG